MNNPLSQLPDADLHGSGCDRLLDTIELCKDIFFSRAFMEDPLTMTELQTAY